MLKIRKTKELSFFPVGLISKLGISSPVVREGKIVGFFDGWIGSRVFAVDMAGFAVSVKTLKKAWSKTEKLEMPFKVSYEEDGFLRNLGIRPEDGEPLADNCTKVLVWHTQTYPPNISKVKIRVDGGRLANTNIPLIYPIP